MKSERNSASTLDDAAEVAAAPGVQTSAARA